MKVLAMVNNAGSQGKTTVAFNLAHGLATHYNQRVLVIDCDHQMNLTYHAGIPQDLELQYADGDDGSGDNIDAVLKGLSIYDTLLKSALLPTPVLIHGVSVIPACVDLDEAERHVSTNLNPQEGLADSLDLFKDDYDLVVLDCPPSFGNITTIMLMVATHVAVPLTPNFKGTQGSQRVIRKLKLLNERSRRKSHVKLLGYTITQIDLKGQHARASLEYIHTYCKNNGIPILGELSNKPTQYNNAMAAGYPIAVNEGTTRAVKLEMLELVDRYAAALGLEAVASVPA